MTTPHPTPGYYYHYKHDPSGPINNYAYEVMGVGHHTEDDAREIDKYVVVYRPLYEAFVYKNGKMFDIRPLSMFMETVEKDGAVRPSFTPITDAATIGALQATAKEMYGA
jgi:hypothetical protein